MVYGHTWDRGKNGRTARVPLLMGLALVCLVCIQGTSAFNTEYHAALTAQTLSRYHFNSEGITSAKIFNYYDDAAEKANQQDRIDIFYWFSQNDANEGRADNNMHFDGLDNVAEVSAVWKRLEKNTHYAVMEAAEKKDTKGMQAILGMSLHTVQDFYAHSNWSEVTEEHNWGDATWLDIPDDVKLNLYVKTEGHDELNKDYASRTNFETAYREAYYASRQWIDLVHSWVSDDFWEKTVNSESIQAYDKVWYETMLLNWYAGSWNAMYSRSHGNVFFMEIFPFATNIATTSPFISKWDDYASTIASDNEIGTYNPSYSSYSYIPEVRWLKIETNEVRQIGDETIDIEPGFIVGASADFYTIIDINGLGYAEAPYSDHDDVILNPTASGAPNIDAKWITLVPLEDDQISITYSLWEDDFIARGSSDQADLVTADDEESWRYTGDVDEIAGQHIITHGDDNDYCEADFQISVKDRMRIPSGPPKPHIDMNPLCGPVPLEVHVGSPIHLKSEVVKWEIQDPVSEPQTFIQKKIGPLSFPTGPSRIVNVTLTMMSLLGENSVTQDILVGGCPPHVNFEVEPRCVFDPPGDVQLIDRSLNTPASWLWHISNISGTYLLGPFDQYQQTRIQRFYDTSQVWLTVTNSYGTEESGKVWIYVGSPDAIEHCAPQPGPEIRKRFLPDFGIYERIDRMRSDIYEWVMQEYRTMMGRAPETKPNVVRSLPVEMKEEGPENEPGEIEVIAPETSTTPRQVTETGRGPDVSSRSRITIEPLQPPRAAFTMTPASGTPPLQVTFDASASRGLGSSLVGYAWVFGDGTTGSGLTITHTYNSPGAYSILLTVTDADGFTNTATHSITVSPHQPPRASFTMTPTSGTSPLQVTFDASASSGVASSLVGYAWVFGDGTTGSGRTITHTYNSPGTYSILLTVTDADGFTNTATHVVPVSASQNVPPVAEKFQIQQPNVLPSAIMTISTSSGYVPLTVFFDASGSSDSDGTIVSYFWDFGDGIPFGGRQVSHTFWHSSTYPVRLTVTDDRGGQGVATQTIQVTTMSSHYRDRYKIEAPEPEPIIY